MDRNSRISRTASSAVHIALSLLPTCSRSRGTTTPRNPRIPIPTPTEKCQATGWIAGHGDNSSGAAIPNMLSLRATLRRSDFCFWVKAGTNRINAVFRHHRRSLIFGRFRDDCSHALSKRRKEEADPSTHHPQTEKRLGPRSLRMTGWWWEVGGGSVRVWECESAG